MKFDVFVIPFSVGLVGLIILLTVKYTRWIISLSRTQRKQIRKSFFSLKFFTFIKDIVTDVLLHLRIFKTNPVLGYMHSSLAFGWFLLIVFGAIEADLASTSTVNNLYEPIFFKYFHHDLSDFAYRDFFSFLMDFLLLYVLSGVLLAIIKRFYSRLMGMKRTTRLFWTDKMALYSLWLIFPIRLLAESTTAGIYHNGGFMTNSIGNGLAILLPLHHIEYPVWWLYSIDLLVFFAFLPFSRYMHIPTEMVLIALRQSGIYTKNVISGYSQFEIFSCSSCGICIDVCQVQSITGRNGMVPAYMFQKIRHGKLLKPAIYDCLMCGRCQQACPVRINIINLKLVKRNEKLNHKHQHYEYLQPIELEKKPTRIAYFAGCMSQLTPSIPKAMQNIFKQVDADYFFMDENGTICCGRPLQLAGKYDDAQILMKKNIELIHSSHAEMLVTSCPICYKVFNEEYSLDIPVYHHSQLFAMWMKEGKLPLHKQALNAVYHDPCDLGRGSSIYEQPRIILRSCVELNEPKGVVAEKSLCCGGSLGNFYFQEKDKVQVAHNAYNSLVNNHTDCLITACPLCKKTFQKVAEIPVMDIAEIVAKSL